MYKTLTGHDYTINFIPFKTIAFKAFRAARNIEAGIACQSQVWRRKLMWLRLVIFLRGLKKSEITVIVILSVLLGA